MRCRFLWVVVLNAIVPAGADQATVPSTLPAALREHIRTERFDLVTSIRGLPLGVRDALQALFEGQALDIAEPGADFQRSDHGRTSAKLPLRRLIAAGCSRDHCLVYYERGGTDHSFRAVLFKWTPTETRVELGGQVRGDLGTFDGVKKAVIGGAVAGSTTVW